MAGNNPSHLRVKRVYNHVESLRLIPGRSINISVWNMIGKSSMTETTLENKLSAASTSTDFSTFIRPRQTFSDYCRVALTWLHPYC
jgi:hypothetical protein